MIVRNCKGCRRIACPVADTRDETTATLMNESERMPQSDNAHEVHIVVLEGSPLGTPTSKTFSSTDAAEMYVIERIRATVSPAQRDRFEKALADQVVSEDGVAAVSSVIAGKLAFVRALAAAYAPKITITSRRYDDDEDSDR